MKYEITKYTYLEQIHHKMKLGFKLNKLETYIYFFEIYNLANKLIEEIKKTTFLKN